MPPSQRDRKLKHAYINALCVSKCDYEAFDALKHASGMGYRCHVYRFKIGIDLFPQAQDNYKSI